MECDTQIKPIREPSILIRTFKPREAKHLTSKCRESLNSLAKKLREIQNVELEFNRDGTRIGICEIVNSERCYLVEVSWNRYLWFPSEPILCDSKIDYSPTKMKESVRNLLREYGYKDTIGWPGW